MNNNIIEIEFKGRRKEHAANPQQFPFRCGDPVIVSTERGYDLGVVSYCGLRGEIEDEGSLAVSVIRKATDEDVDKLKQNRIREHDAKRVAKQKIADHHLEMKLVDVESQWDGKKLTFFFTADGRVDFRELVKDLASTFRTRIDLRQIGARDETRKTGGFGVCGEPLCCSTHLMEFKPITTQMPRDQLLPLNPTKLSGVCGRLKCCLRYELEGYREFQKNCPKVGHLVRDENKGEGAVEKIDMIRKMIHIRYENGGFEQINQEEFLEISDWKPQMPKNEHISFCSRGESVFVPAPPAEEEDERAIASSGDRITIDDRGLSVRLEGDSSSVSVQTDVNASDAPKKKKRRSRRKASSSKNKTAAAESKQQASQSSDEARKPEKKKQQKQKQPQQAQVTQPVKEGKEPASTAKKKRRRRGGRRVKRSGKESDSQ